MDQAREFLTHFASPMGYLIFFMIITFCCIGLPLNSDFMFITSAVLSSMGYFQLWIMIVLGFVALMCGDSINFFVARRWGKKLIRVRPVSWVIKAEKVEMAETYLNKKGTKFIFLVRFLPLIRTVLYFTAGSLQVKPKIFLLMNAGSTLIYLPALMGAAYLASTHIDQVVDTLKEFQFGLLGLVVTLALFFTIKKKIKKPALS